MVKRSRLKKGTGIRKNRLWFITPRNEGQELNYMEDHEGSLESAKKRAQFMADKLQEILKEGQISVSVEDEDLEEVAFKRPRSRYA